MNYRSTNSVSSLIKATFVHQHRTFLCTYSYCYSYKGIRPKTGTLKRGPTVRHSGGCATGHARHRRGLKTSSPVRLAVIGNRALAPPAALCRAEPAYRSTYPSLTHSPGSTEAPATRAQRPWSDIPRPASRGSLSCTRVAPPRSRQGRKPSRSPGHAGCARRRAPGCQSGIGPARVYVRVGG